MTEFTAQNFQEALAKVYYLASMDEAYRLLCLAEPRAALARVSDIVLPDSFMFNFVNDDKEVLYSFVLPPSLEGLDDRKRVKELIDWAIAGGHITHPTTTVG